MEHSIRSGLEKARGERNHKVDELLGGLLLTNRSLVCKILNHIELKDGDKGYVDLLNNPEGFLDSTEVSSDDIQSIIGKIETEFGEKMHHENQNILKSLLERREINIQNEQNKIDKLWQKIVDNQSNEQLDISTDLIESPTSDSILPILGQDNFLLGGENDLMGGQGELMTIEPIHIDTLSAMLDSGKNIDGELLDMIKSVPKSLPINLMELTEEEAKKLLPEVLEILKSTDPLKDLGYFLDFINKMRRSGNFLELDPVSLKKLQNITEKTIEKKVNHQETTLRGCYRTLVEGSENLFSRNICVKQEEVENFYKISRKNNANSQYGLLHEMASLIRIAMKTQDLYVQRMEDLIVPYYKSKADELLETFSDLELKLFENGKKLQDYFDDPTTKRLQRSIEFIANIRGYMGGKGLITDPQQSSFVESFSELTSSIQFMLDNDESFQEIFTQECVRKKGEEEKILMEINTKLYDKQYTRVGDNVSKHIAFRFKKIDLIIQKVLGMPKADLWSYGSQFIKKLLENPEIEREHRKTCPELFDIVNQYT